MAALLTFIFLTEDFGSFIVKYKEFCKGDIDAHNRGEGRTLEDVLRRFIVNTQRFEDEVREENEDE